MTRYNKFTVDGIEYTWYGGLGGMFYSKERNLKVGDVRVINDMQFYVYSIEKNFLSAPYVNWSQLDINLDKTREIKKKMFNIEG